MRDSRLVYPILASVLGLVLGVACSEGTNEFEEGDGGGATGGAAGSGVSGSSGAAGNAGSTSSSGGAASGAGGAGATAGTSAGAAPAAGMGGTASGTGGAGPSGGTGGGSAGTGTSGTGGVGGMAPTSGCAAATWPPGDGTTLLSIDVDGTPREYIVQLPANYDTNHPYRLVFAWHGRSGTAAQVARNFYGLENGLGSSTIFVSGQGLGTEEDPAETGWPNTNGQDIALVRALVASLSSSYCIDQNRIMSVGMSYGGIMSYHIACQMPDVFRAIAPIAGASFGGRGTMCGVNPIAVWAAHGTADETVTFTSGESAMNEYVMRNHCQTTSTPVEPQPYCSEFQGCDAGYPVVWCVHDGGHTVPQWSGAAIAAFFEQF